MPSFSLTRRSSSNRSTSRGRPVIVRVGGKRSHSADGQKHKGGRHHHRSRSADSGKGSAERRGHSRRRQSHSRPSRPRGVPKFLANMRLCYVCGQRVTKNSLEIHEKKCTQHWFELTKDLPSHMITQPPIKISIPSVDGTFDTDRLDEVATESFQRANKAYCRKCKENVQIADVRDHARSCTGPRRRSSSLNRFHSEGGGVLPDLPY